MSKPTRRILRVLFSRANRRRLKSRPVSLGKQNSELVGRICLVHVTRSSLFYRRDSHDRSRATRNQSQGNIWKFPNAAAESFSCTRSLAHRRVERDRLEAPSTQLSVNLLIYRDKLLRKKFYCLRNKDFCNLMLRDFSLRRKKETVLSKEWGKNYIKNI